MSGNVDVNINDNSGSKISPDKKICNIKAKAAETETRTDRTDKLAAAASVVNDLNKNSDLADAQEGDNSLSNEERGKDTDIQETKDKGDERGASCSKSSLQSDVSGGENKTQDKQNDRQRKGKGPLAVSDSEAAKSVDPGTKESDVRTTSAEESLEKLRMNIETDETCQTSSHHVEGSPASQSSADNGSNEQNSQVDNEAEDKECAAGEKEGTSTETTQPDPEGKDAPSEADQHSDKTHGAAGPKERGKSDSENEESDDDVVMESAPEDSSQDTAEDKISNIGDIMSHIKNSDTGSRQTEKDEDKLEASGRTESSDVKKDTKGDESLKPSDFLPARLARIKRLWSDRDTQMYRDGYPGKKDEPGLTMNLDFYQGRIRCRPNGDYIDKIHEDWWNDHDLLEVHHGYIQWLFPIRESGMNWEAQELQLHEAEAIKADERAMQRFKMSYEMMLNFYGIRLISTETGEVERAQNWRNRFRHLNYSMHNYLRITRILKCLGELGLEPFKAPFLRFMLHEAIMTGELSRTLESCYNYWIGTVKDEEERQSIQDYAKQLCLQVEKMEKNRGRRFQCPLE